MKYLSCSNSGKPAPICQRVLTSIPTYHSLARGLRLTAAGNETWHHHIRRQWQFLIKQTCYHPTVQPSVSLVFAQRHNNVGPQEEKESVCVNVYRSSTQAHSSLKLARRPSVGDGRTVAHLNGGIFLDTKKK